VVLRIEVFGDARCVVVRILLDVSGDRNKGFAVGRNMSLKNPVTAPGIDPGTVRLVAQRLNHYAIPGPTFMIIPRSVLIRVRNVSDKSC
jgi:hypothetical protein